MTWPPFTTDFSYHSLFTRVKEKSAARRVPQRLVVPAGNATLWTPAATVALYRERMQIEQSFRDFKTHLGLRGLRLKVRSAEWMGRLLLALCLAYALLVVVGATPEGQKARQDLEIPRAQPRHGTTRTQTELSVGGMMLSHPRHAAAAFRVLGRLLTRLTRGWVILPERLHSVPLAAGPPATRGWASLAPPLTRVASRPRLPQSSPEGWDAEGEEKCVRTK